MTLVRAARFQNRPTSKTLSGQVLLRPPLVRGFIPPRVRSSQSAGPTVRRQSIAQVPDQDEHDRPALTPTPPSRLTLPRVWPAFHDQPAMESHPSHVWIDASA